MTVDDVALRAPKLDEVFLALTGQSLEDETRARDHGRGILTPRGETTMATTEVSAPTHSTTLPVSALVIAKRTVLKFLRTPQLVLLGTCRERCSC